MIAANSVRLPDTLGASITTESSNRTAVQELVRARLSTLVGARSPNCSARLDQDRTKVSLTTDDLGSKALKILLTCRNLEVDVDGGHGSNGRLISLELSDMQHYSYESGNVH
jgi:hypothetical protein